MGSRVRPMCTGSPSAVPRPPTPHAPFLFPLQALTAPHSQLWEQVPAVTAQALCLPTLRPYLKAQPSPLAREVPTATRDRGQPPNVSADCPSLPSIISVHPLISGEGLAPIPILSEPSGEAQGGPPSRSTPGQLLPPRQRLGHLGGRWGCTGQTRTPTRLNTEKGSFAQETSDGHPALPSPKPLGPAGTETVAA